MSNVNLTIGGRNFTVSAQPGEEQHIEALGRMIDAKLRAMGGSAGASESRMLLFAALLMADEVHELRSGGDSEAARKSVETETRLAQVPTRIAAMAERVEALAAALEKAGQDA